MIPIVAFWIFTGLGLYVWIGYPILLKLASSVFGKPYSLQRVPDDRLPTISVLIAVHNGERRMRQKLDSAIALDYPKGVMDILVVSDRSTDSTEEIVREYEDRGVRLIVSTTGGGKSAAQNFAMETITSEIVVLTDLEADLAPDFLRVVASAFADEKVGCISSEVMWRNTDEGENPRAGGVYWRFEIALRRWESRLNAMAYASGQAMAFRRCYFKPLREYAGDDCLIPLDVTEQGGVCLSVAEAQSTDLWAAEAGSEFSARVRMTQRNMTGTLMYPALLNPVKRPLIAWSLMSHKILRWLTPYFVIGGLVANAFLLEQSFYVATFILALAGLGISTLGLTGQILGIRIPVAGALGSLLVVNAGFFIGVLKSMSGRKVYVYGRPKTP